MAVLNTQQIAQILTPFGVPLDGGQLATLETYLDLLVKWNARTNLTAIREPEEMVRRHFGESLFAGQLLPKGFDTVLDLGSGGGFPGVPIQILRPEIKVTLAESQGKKATFLREVVRTLGLPSEVWADRVEKLNSQFDVVAMRAVDRMAEMSQVARSLVKPEGRVLLLTTRAVAEEPYDGLLVESVTTLPNSGDGVVGVFHVEQLKS